MAFKQFTQEERTLAEDILKDPSAHTSMGMSPSWAADGVEVYRAEDGDNAIRLLPPSADEDYLPAVWYKEIWWLFHGGSKQYFISTKAYDQKQRDPIHEAFMRHKDTNKELANEFKGSPRSLCWIMDQNDGGKVKLWAAPRKLTLEIFAQCKNPRSGEVIRIWDVLEGPEIYFTKTGQGINTDYRGVKLATQPFPVPESAGDHIMKFSVAAPPTPVADAEALVKTIEAEYGVASAAPAQTAVPTRMPEQAAPPAAPAPTGQAPAAPVQAETPEQIRARIQQNIASQAQ